MKNFGMIRESWLKEYPIPPFFERIIRQFSAMIHVYANYTREISMLPGDYLSVWQPPQAVSILRKNMAYSTQEKRKKAKTLFGSFAAKICELQQNHCVGKNRKV